MKLFLYLFSIFAFIPFLTAESDKTTSTRYYALSLIHGVKYKHGFKHFDYVNPNAPKGGKLKMGTSLAFDSLNPFVVIGNAAQGIGITHATLFDEGEDEPSTSYPYVAEYVDISDDKKHITFHLNTKAVFHDGEPVTAHDVVFTFNTLRDKGKPMYKQYYADVVEAKALDDHTVLFISKNPKNKELPSILGQLVVLPKNYYEKHEFDVTSLNPVPGAGPYKVKSVDPGQKIVYEKVSKWWGEKIPSQVGHHNFQEIEYTTYRDDTAFFEAFKKGLIDLRMENSSQNWVINYDFDAVKQGKVKKIVLPEKNPKPTYGIFFNTRNDLLKDINVRKAIILCFDFEWMNKNLFYNLYKRNNSYFPFSYLSSEGKRSGIILKILEPYRDKLPKEVFEQDVEEVCYKTNDQKRRGFKKAQDLLEQAGYDLVGGKRVHKKTKKILEFNFLIKSPKVSKIALSLKENLERVGINLNIQQIDVGSYAERLESYDYDLVLEIFAQSTTPGNEQTNYFGSKSVTSKGGMNYAGIHDEVIDALIKKIKNHETDQDLVDTVQAMDFVLLHGAYMIPAWSFDGFMVAYWDHIGFNKKQPAYTRNFIARWWKKVEQ